MFIPIKTGDGFGFASQYLFDFYALPFLLKKYIAALNCVDQVYAEYAVPYVTKAETACMSISQQLGCPDSG